MLGATRGLSSVSIDLAAKYTWLDPWRAWRALGVNEGRSCDRSIFPKSRGGPIRRHVKAGRIISNLYCRRIRARARVRSFAERTLLSSLHLVLSRCPRSLSFSFIVVPFYTPTLSFEATLQNNFIHKANNVWHEGMREVRAVPRAFVDGVGSAGSRKGRTSGRGDGTRLSYAIANYWQFDPLITQFEVIGPRRARSLLS